MILYFNACLEFISAFIALACGFATTAWVIFTFGIIIFMLAIINSILEER
jgi:hypothetical protein